MSLALIKKLREQRTALLAELGPLLALMEAGNPLTAEQDARFTAVRTEAAALDTRIAELMEFESARLAAAGRDRDFDGTAAVEPGAAARNGAARTSPRTTAPLPGVGQQFTSTTEFERFASRDTDTTGMVEVRFGDITTTTPSEFPLGGYVRARSAATPTAVSPILDACGFELITGGSFFWDDWTPLEGQAVEVDEGAPKPELPGVPDIKSGVLGKIAVHKKITTEALEDVPNVQSQVEGALMRALLRKAESTAATVITGSTLIPTATGGADLLAAIRIGIAEIQIAEFQAIDVLLHPMEYANIDIDLLARTLAGARRDVPVWALNVVPSGRVPQGSAFVGSLMDGVTTFARANAAVKMGLDGDDFTRNKVTLLGEQRMTVKVTQPLALVKVSPTPPTP
jgi:hypothetical protein